MKYIVEYQFTDTLEIISKEFNDFLQAMKYQGEILKKYTKMIDFISIYKKHLPFKSKKIVIGWTIKTKEELYKYIPLSDNLIVENIL